MSLTVVPPPAEIKMKCFRGLAVVIVATANRATIGVTWVASPRQGHDDFGRFTLPCTVTLISMSSFKRLDSSKEPISEFIAPSRRV